MIKKLRYLAEAIPGFGLASIAAKEINLIKTQKIALALILLYPIIVIGTLGAAFSGSSTLGKVDVAFYSPKDIQNFDANNFTTKLRNNPQVNLLPLDSEQQVREMINSRKAKLGIIIHEPEPTQGRYVIDILNDNSNINRAVFFFQVANDSVRRVGFDIARELLSQIWINLSGIKEKLRGEVDRVDSFIAQLDGSESELLDLNRSINELDIAEMREKLAKQETTLKSLDPKIEAFGKKMATFSDTADKKIALITDTQGKLANYRGEIHNTKTQMQSIKGQLDQYKEIFAAIPDAKNAYNKLVSTEGTLAQAESDLDNISGQLATAKSDLIGVKKEFSGTQASLDEIRSNFKSAQNDLNYFNDQLNHLGKTVDKMNAMISSSLETKKKVKKNLEESKTLMTGFVSKLDELNALSPQFLANPIIINKINAYDATNLQIITPMALVLVLLLTTLLLTGVSFVVERNEGSYSRLILSPSSKLKIFAGKILGQIIFALIEAGIILTIAIFGFGIKIAGKSVAPAGIASLLSLKYYIATAGVIFSAPYIAAIAQILAGLAIISFSFIALGLFISNYTKVQSTTILAGLLVVIPMIFISGILIPIELMSEAIQATSSFLPLTLGATIATELMIKGSGLGSLVPELIQLLVPALIFFGFTLANRNL